MQIFVFGNIQKRLSVKQSYGLRTVADTYRCRARVCGVERSPYSTECGTEGGPSPDPRFRTRRPEGHPARGERDHRCVFDVT